MADKICPWCGEHYEGHHMATSCDKPECKAAQLDNLKKTRYEHQVTRRQSHPDTEDRRCPLCCRAESKCKCICPDCGKPMYKQVNRYAYDHHVRMGPECRRYDPWMSARCQKWYRRRLKIVRQIKYSNFVEMTQ